MIRMLGIMFVVGLMGFAAVAAVPRTQSGSLVTFFSGKCLQGPVSKDCPRKHASR